MRRINFDYIDYSLDPARYVMLLEPEEYLDPKQFELKVHKGASANQVKPVLLLDVPMKQKFFFWVLEDGNQGLVERDW